MTVPPIAVEFPGLSAALAGQYELERELGRGGMGIVFLARDLKLDRAVALKVLPPALATNPATRERFLREARTAAQLAHPHIVPIYRADELGGFAFFAMGFVDGETLAERVAARGALPAPDVVRMLREAAWALAYAHVRGVIHRDVKPENIMCDRATGQVLVTDFGIAHAPEATRLTATGSVMGSVHFMSPEQGAGEPLDGRSDLYALGTVGFYLLSGRMPFMHESAAAVLVQRATREPPALRSVAADVPAPIAAVIDRCLARDREQRFSDGEAMADALGRALEDSGGMATSSRVLDDAQAAAVWQRAAQLQAEAAARLEARARETKSLPAGSPDGKTPDGGYREREVAQAAIEAGISRQYVAVALAELQSQGGAAQSLVSSKREASLGAQLVLGAKALEISVSRRIRQPPRRVLQSMGKALQASPIGLSLQETLGAHALEGGVLVFRIPEMGEVATGIVSSYYWTWTRYQTWSRQVRAQLTQIPGDSTQCELTLTVDLREGLKSSLWESAGISGGGSAGGGFIGLLASAYAKKHAAAAIVLLGKQVLGAIGLAAGVGPVITLGAMGGLVVGFIGNRLLYRHAYTAVARELTGAIDAVERDLLTQHTFGDPFGEPTPRGSLPSGPPTTR